jgi:hypothetical protein
MTSKAMLEILSDLPEKTIVHLKTINNDKLCIRDNNKTNSSKITCVPHDDFLEVISKNKSDKKASTNKIYVSYDCIVQIETTINETLPNESPED